MKSGAIISVFWWLKSNRSRKSRETRSTCVEKTWPPQLAASFVFDSGATFGLFENPGQQTSRADKSGP
jgi:hypothetical protein